jgi:hypothetical protein
VVRGFVTPYYRGTAQLRCSVVGTDTTAPNGVSWNFKIVADGWVGVTTLAFDAANN